MSTGRRNARRQAVFILYQQDLLGLTWEAALTRIKLTEVDAYARGLVRGVALRQEAIDRLLTEHITGWSLDRLGILERSILRVAAYELVWETDVPEAVVIDEAVELSKRFCSAEAGALVNGVLGSMVRCAVETAAVKDGSDGEQS
ncbi:MAG: transcription antitermination factor NusB [Actinobacteria bacterium RBG_16_64_13]|nr:MAG: transcription antitermination factor NusB [Actinobacteria bacterium RBG_16_64_13]